MGGLVEEAEELGAPEPCQTEEEEEVFEGEEAVAVAGGQVEVDKFEHELLVCAYCVFGGLRVLRT